MVKGFKNFKKFIAIAVGLSIALPVLGTMGDNANAYGNTLKAEKVTEMVTNEAGRVIEIEGTKGIKLDWTAQENKTYVLSRSVDGSKTYTPVGNYNGVMPFSYKKIDINGSKYLAPLGETYKINVLPLVPKGSNYNYLKQWFSGRMQRINGLYINIMDPVSFDKFNVNDATEQNKYLYKVHGAKENVDVIFIGTTDTNGQEDLSQKAKESLASFVKNGNGGIIFAHDTIALGESPKKYNDTWSNFWKLASTDITGNSGIDFLKPYDGYYTANPDLTNNGNYASNESSTVKMTKLGSLTSYPFNLNTNSNYQKQGKSVKHKVGTSHNTGQQVVSSSDKWFEFTDVPYEKRTLDNTNANFFLATRNYVNPQTGSVGRMGMIQTGHSSTFYGTVGITSSELDMITNMIYYMANTISTSTYTDETAVDIAAPSVKATVESSTKGDVSVSLKATDNGTQYHYYVYEFDKDADVTEMTGGKYAVPKYETMAQPMVVKSGLKDVYYMVDENENAVVNDSSFVRIKSLDSDDTATINYKISQSNQYIHIKATDYAGNSAIETYKIGKDASAPIVKIGDTVLDENTVIDTQPQKDSTQSDFDNLFVDDSGRDDKKNDLESGIMGYGLSKTKTDEPTSYVDNKDDVDLKSLGSGIRWLWIKDNAGNITKVKIRIHSDLFYVDSNGVKYEINEVQYVTEDGTTDMQEYYYGDKDTRIFY